MVHQVRARRLLQVRVCGLGAERDAEGVDVDLPLDLVRRDVVDLALVEDAGIVVEDVECAAGARGELGESFGPLLRLADVEGAGDEVGMVGLHLRQRVGIDVVDADCPPVAAETLRGGETDSGSAAGDEDGGHGELLATERTASTPLTCEDDPRR